MVAANLSRYEFRVGDSVDFFKLYSVKKEFLLDLNELKLKQKMLLKETHPDLFVNATAVEKKVASEFATLVNKAFGVLRDPLTRGEHLCSILGLQVDMEKITFVYWSQDANKIMYKDLQWNSTQKNTISVTKQKIK